MARRHPVCLERAAQEAAILASQGAHGIIVENFGDAPFHPWAVGPETVAAMTLAVSAVIDTVGVPIGINVLRNDPCSAIAIAIAAATGAPPSEPMCSTAPWSPMRASCTVPHTRPCDTGERWESTSE